LEDLLEREDQAKAALRSASDLYVSANLARWHALSTGDMARFQRATDAVKKALGREAWASDSLSALRPEIHIASTQAGRLDDEAAGWEELYWHCTAYWLLEVWSTELQPLVSVERVLDWYRAFGHDIREQIEAEVDVFAKTVRRLTANR
jgi:hypothetical protein